ncbi:hypothetical protein E0W68_09220 [Flavobacterium salilacus subsp. salilacus]|uniref:hypothetical protein n=1 Tax=Flavobacterium TaxID=237 RepID=UPI0010751B97|nr:MULTISPECIES: hypothetical protein [Flavobacterium]KAF2518495.1 hypothetical protein E0W68_09220 [Flavobacterium salilacus subsp. salilacus]MBE1615135.1 hypothetical protein [Flavobacterium sp. SaA2.13]
MDSTALKNNIIARIKNASDDLLLDIARLIKADDDAKIIFSEEEAATIQASIKSYEEGNYLTDKVAEQDIQKWLKD